MSFWDRLKERIGYKEKKRQAYVKLGQVATRKMAEEAEEFLFGPDEPRVDPEEQARREARAAREREQAERKRLKEEARAATRREAEIERELAELKKRARSD